MRFRSSSNKLQNNRGRVERLEDRWLLSAEAIAFDLTDDLAEYLTFKEKSPPKLSFDLWRTAQTNIDPGNDLVHSPPSYTAIEAYAIHDAASLSTELESLGLIGSASAGVLVSGLFPSNRLEQLEALSNLRFARRSETIFNVGQVTSQGVESMRSDIARGIFGVDGTGVTVGVISNSFDLLGGYADDVLSGDLPPGIIAIEPPMQLGRPDQIDEGRAMMQLIHDVAPGANLIFHTSGGTGDPGIAMAIRELAAAGADIIVDDVSNLAQPFFQDGAAAQAVDEVVAAGISYFSVAGNSGRQSYQSAFANSGIPLIVEGMNAGELHDFDPGPGVDVFQRITIPPLGILSLGLQWDEPFLSAPGSVGSGSDLDVHLLNASTTGRLLFSADPNVGMDAVEILTFPNLSPFDLTVNLAITHRAGPLPGLIKYIYSGDAEISEYATNSSTLFGHANAAGAEAVGAAAYFNTPEFGVSPPIREPFSSAGGTPILFDVSGQRIEPIVRAKPEIVAPDNTNTTFFGQDIPEDPDLFPNFPGTSAAAPHAAAVAALMLQYDPSLTPAEIYQVLEATAIDMEDPGFDFNTGFGLIQADAALAALNKAPVAIDDFVTTLVDTPITFNPATNDFDLDGVVVPSSLVIQSLPTNGTVTEPFPGQVQYAPNPNFSGIDSFTYIVFDDDGAASNLARVAVTVLSMPNDAPTAVDDAFTTLENVAITVTPTQNDFDPDGVVVPTTLMIQSGPSNGLATINPSTGQVTYKPAAKFNGTDTLTYVVFDDDGAASNEATVTITVTPVNDSPVAKDDVASTGVNVPLLISVLDNDFDPDGPGNSLSVQIIQPPLHGTTLVDFGTQRVMYRPDPGFAGADIFTYRVVDNEGAFSNVARVTLRVGDPVSFAGAVFADRNNDGFFQGDELGIPGVTITIAKIDGPVTFSLSVQTGLDGSFSLFEVPGSSILPAGVYSITEQHPTQFLDGIDTLGTVGGIALNDVFQNITLGSGQAATGYLFGERGLNAGFLAANPQLRRFFASAEPGDLGDFYDLLLVSPGDAVGAVNQAGFSLRTTNSVTPAGLPSFNFGLPQWHPISGDWNGDGIDTIGAYNSETATFFLTDSNDGGVANHPAFNFGLPGWVPLAGDWNGDGVDTIGVYNPTTATFFLRNHNSTGVAEVPAFNYGIPNWVPLAGDWEGLGIDTIGAYNPATATYFLRFTNDSGPADVAPFNYGMPGWRPVVGDWNDDGIDTAGVHNPATSTFFLRNSNTSGVGEVVFNHGSPGSVALAGHWMPMSGQPLLLDGEAGPVTSFDVRLTTEDIVPLLAESVGKWAAAGVDPASISQLMDVDIHFTDLPGRQLGLATRDRVYLDYNAAGQGWFVDPTPGDNEEFLIQTAEGLLAAGDQPAAERVDLLSVITHELGHLLGLDDRDDDPAELMYESLATGRRKLPSL